MKGINTFSLKPAYIDTSLESLPGAFKNEVDHLLFRTNEVTIANTVTKACESLNHRNYG